MRTDNNYHLYALFAALYVSESSYSLYMDYINSRSSFARGRAIGSKARAMVVFDRVVGSMYNNARDFKIVSEA